MKNVLIVLLSFSALFFILTPTYANTEIDAKMPIIMANLAAKSRSLIPLLGILEDMNINRFLPGLINPGRKSNTNDLPIMINNNLNLTEIDSLPIVLNCNNLSIR